MYSKTDASKIVNWNVMKRLNELVPTSNSTIEILGDKVYLKPIISNIMCEIFTVSSSNKANSGLSVRACLYSDMIRPWIVLS